VYAGERAAAVFENQNNAGEGGSGGEEPDSVLLTAGRRGWKTGRSLQSRKGRRVAPDALSQWKNELEAQPLTDMIDAFGINVKRPAVKNSPFVTAGQGVLRIETGIPKFL
jgi:hypothetical protein